MFKLQHMCLKDLCQFSLYVGIPRVSLYSTFCFVKSFRKLVEPSRVLNWRMLDSSSIFFIVEQKQIHKLLIQQTLDDTI